MAATLVRVRLASADDAPLIADLHVRSWRASYRHFLPPEYLAGLDAAAHAERYWRPLLERSDEVARTWVAEAGAEPAGFISVEGPLGVPPPEEALPGCGYVHHIHVVPEFLGQRVGFTLWRAGLEALAASGYPEATLAVYEPNTRARAFYEAQGWRADGWSFERRFPSAGGDVPVVMLRYRGPTSRVEGTG